jgi:hypothetical protein
MMDVIKELDLCVHAPQLSGGVMIVSIHIGWKKELVNN